MMAFPSLPRPWAAAAIAAVVSFVLCPLLIQLAPRLGLMDEPDEGRKKHGRPVPLVGGIGVALAVLAALSGEEDPEILWLALVILGLGGVGLLDDRLGLGAGPKLGLQLLLPSLVIGLTWYATDFCDIRTEGVPAVMLLLLGAWLVLTVLLTNALNFTDNSNGLCAGLSVILLAAEGWAMGKANAVLAFSFAAGLLGFLPWNYPAARAFLGDCGSHLAGASVGMCASVILLVSPAPLAPRFLGVGLILAIPLLDMAVAVGGRLRRGQAPWKGDLTHLSHRLVARGLKPAAAVAVLWLAAIVTSAAGVILLTWRQAGEG